MLPPMVKMDYKGKVAFCFLLYDTVQHSKRWEKFFKGYDQYYNIYTHPKLITRETQKWVEDHAVKTVPTQWGDMSLIMATIRLFKTALRDPSNKFFALISGTCIPVHDFEYTYKRMMRHPQSKITYVRNHRDEDGTVWGSQESTYAYSQEQWMILNRDTAKQLCRLADKKDTQAQAFL